MLKLCGDAICNQALISVLLPSDWKKANIKRPTLGQHLKKLLVQSPCSLFVIKSSKDFSFLTKYLDLFFIIN